MSVRTNDRADPLLVLVGTARVKHTLRAEPPPGQSGTFKFKRFSRDSEGETMTIMLVRGEGGPLRPKVRKVGFHGWDEPEPEVRFESSPNLSAIVRELEPGERYELTVTARPPWPPTTEIGHVVLDTGLPEQPEHTLYFFLDVE